MRKIFMFIAASFVMATSAMAQDMAIPADKDVRVGKLDCGITYYVRQNAKPENQAEFYILHNVGAIQEEDDQQGLAHFLEHMAFNGTKNMPGKKIIEWCEKNGIKFGANLNASTGVERTLYNVSAAPINRPGVLDTCLLILHEWSQFVDLSSEKEIDDERGVIIEEKRTRNTSSWRMMEKSLPVFYGDTKYAKRNIIGSEEGLKTFKYDQLRDFYHRWYRTDMQAIIVVGDFNADEVVGKIKTLFADVKPIENPEPKGVYEIPENKEPIIAVLTDPENTDSEVEICIKHKPLPNNLNSNMSAYGLNLMKSLFYSMANTRLREIAQKPNAPFISAGMGGYRMTATLDAIFVDATAREGETLKALDAAYAELEKIRRFGFTESEFEIAKANYLKSAETAYNNRNDRRNGDFIGTYVSNFRYNTYMPDAETDWQMKQMLLNNINVDIINQIAPKLITLENQIVMFSLPEKEGAIPTKDEVAVVVEKVRNEELEAYKDNVVKEPLIPESTTLAGSKVIKEETDKFGAIVWTLQNGIQVVVKKTDFKADELMVAALALDGQSNLSDDDYVSSMFISDVMSSSGVGKFSAIDLRKQLAGKSASASLSIDDYASSLSAGGSPKDVETILQLIYLNFTSPRWNLDDYNVLMDKYKTMLKNVETQPDYLFSKEYQTTMYNNNPRRPMVSTNLLSQIHFDKMPAIHKKFFGNAKGFTFVFVGSIDAETLKPLVEKYIGSLPILENVEKWKDDGVRKIRGVKDDFFEAKMEAPKTKISYTWTGDIPYTLENSITMSALSQALRTRYTEVIREEKGATYGASVRGSIARTPIETYTLMVNFDTKKEKVDSLNLLADVSGLLEEIAEKGPRAEDVVKIKEYMSKQIKDELKNNGTYLSALTSWHVRNFDKISDYEKYVNDLTGEKIQTLAKKIVADNNLLRVIMNPKE